jgi:hypothetical protein
MPAQEDVTTGEQQAPVHMRAWTSIVEWIKHNPKIVLISILIIIIMSLAYALYRCNNKTDKAGFEGLAAGPHPKGPHPKAPHPTGQPVYVTVPGGTTTQGVSTSARPVAESGLGDDEGLGSDPSGAKWKGHGSCPPWDPEATAEVQALGQVGGFEDDNAYGELRLQREFGHVINDEQLNSIMHQH